MTTKELINELKNMGFEVTSRKRTDGGYIITKINGQTFTGASGNAYARSILGVNLSPARMEQTHFNVEKYIKLGKGEHKAKGKIDEEMERQLRKVQRIYRKTKIKGRITKKTLRGYIKEEGRESAMRYLKRQEQYGRGYAYPENVEYLAQYIEGVAKGIKDSGYKESALMVAERIRNQATTFREEWIKKIYDYWYSVIEHGYDPEIIYKAVTMTLSTID